MANYHFEAKNISRKENRSVIGSASYITGRKLRDSRNGKIYYNQRKDVVWQKILDRKSVV